MRVLQVSGEEEEEEERFEESCYICNSIASIRRGVLLSTIFCKHFKHVVYECVWRVAVEE